MKKLYRSTRHRILFGVCGGLAEYLGVSVALVRLVMLVLSCIGTGVVLYIAGMIIMPNAPVDTAPAEPARAPSSSTTGSLTVGIGLLLVIVGSLWLLDRLDIFSMHAVWHTMRNIVVPLAIILFGIAVLMRRGSSPGQAAPILGPLEQAPVRGGQWYRARYDRKLFGVCAGIAHAMNVDPTVIRLAWVILSLHSLGFGFIVYLILALVLPEEPAATPT